MPLPEPSSRRPRARQPVALERASTAPSKVVVPGGWISPNRRFPRLVLCSTPPQGIARSTFHTPEFSFEHDIDRVRQATKERAIDYPVALDNDYAVWNAFANTYWPALYFVDREGIIRDHHFGEGRYEQSERVIQGLLGFEREIASVEGV